MRLLATAVLLLFTSMANAESFGSFVGRVVASWNPDGRTMTLIKPFAYIDPSGTRWVAPSGSTVDGASIPKLAWSIVGGPFEGKYREASVIHDVACVEKRHPWEKVHYTFYTGMLASGVASAKAKIMFAAVYHFGPRWSEPNDRTIYKGKSITDEFLCIDPPPQTLSPEDFRKLSDEIEAREGTTDPVSLELIRKYR